MNRRIKLAILGAAVAAGLAGQARAVLTFTVESTGWPNEAHRTAAVNAIQSAVNRYNAYGNFGNYNIYVYYNSGIPTAQASYLGSIGFGGTYPNERVTMHELAHYLGSGTYGAPWDGARGEALIDQFDGIEASLQGDSVHFWPYGLNYDSEGSEINKQRQVAMVYAQRADMGIGSTANPWSATVVTQTASDPLGESGFNYAARWSDGYFAHSGAAYSTGSYLLRTPASSNSFTFAGDSLTVNNTNGINGGLLYKGSGTTGAVAFKNLILDGGYVRHASSSSDLFRLAGKVTLVGSPIIDAAQGEIRIAANITGSGSLTKIGGYTLTLTGGNSYTGDTFVNAGILRLAPADAVASYSFDSVSGSTVINSGSGGAAMNGTLANGAAIVAGGRFGNAVSLSGGASVDINSPIIDLSNTNNWTVSAWIKTATPGASILTKGSGTGWGYGNTIFYLGDGTGPGSGAVPSAVRWAGGFYQAAAGSTTVTDNTWHLVTYVNNSGNYEIYVDGVALPLSAGNSSLAVPDVGSVVRLGVSTNTVPSDGTVNYNGLLDSVQFYNQALSAAQIAALHQGATLGALPITTNVTIASGATLDVNGMTQQIASLNGPAGSAVTLGAGQLIVSSATSSLFAGTISGAGGSLVKAGTGTLTLAGNNTYTGGTTVAGGKLIANKLSNGTLSIAASAVAQITQKASPNSASGTTVVPALSIATGGQLDLTNNSMVIDYSGVIGTILDDTRQQLLDGRITSSAADATYKLGYGDNALLGKATFAGVTVDSTSLLIKYTFGGDANLDGQVDITDLAALATAWQTGGVWTDGDFDYSGFIDITDLAQLATNWQAGVGAPLGMSFEQALASVGLVGVSVPEPAAVGSIFAAGAAVLVRRRRQ